MIINESTVVLCPTAFMNPDLSAAAALTSTSLEHHHCIYGARVRVLLLELREDRGVLNHSVLKTLFNLRISSITTTPYEWKKYILYCTVP